MSTKRKAKAVPKAGRDVHLDIRLSTAEKAAFLQAADLMGLTLSDWIRQHLRANARAELENVGISVAFTAIPRQKQKVE